MGSLFTGRGDLTSNDLDQISMTFDGAYHEWDISSIVPAGTDLVYIKADITDDAVGSYVWIQQKDFDGNINNGMIVVQEANKINFGHFLIPCDPTLRLLEYITSNVAINLAHLSVLGWWS